MNIEQIELAIVRRVPWIKGYYFKVLMVLGVAAVSVALFIFRENVINLRNYGYAGAFLISTISSATVFLPVPGILLIAGLATILNPLIIGLVAGLGAGLGESTAYLVGTSGASVIKDSAAYKRAEGWMRRRGAITIFLLACVPNPLFDVAGIAAGALRLPYWQFLVSCVAGNIVKFTGIALAAAWGLHGVLHLMRPLFE